MDREIRGTEDHPRAGVFLQSFDFLLRHIPQAQNKLADYKSRFDLPDINSDPAALLSVLLFLLDEDYFTSSELSTLFALAQDETVLPSDVHAQDAAQRFFRVPRFTAARWVIIGVTLAMNVHNDGYLPEASTWSSSFSTRRSAVRQALFPTKCTSVLMMLPTCVCLKFVMFRSRCMLLSSCWPIICVISGKFLRLARAS